MSKHNSKPVQKNSSAELGDVLNYPSFSFEFLTSQSEFNFDYFKSDHESANEAKAALIDKMILLAQEDWKDLEHLTKRTGFELINHSEIKIKNDHIPFELPEKYIIFRFDKQKFRLIGFKLKSNPVFYILGFDFNYSAYNHG